MNREEIADKLSKLNKINDIIAEENSGMFDYTNILINILFDIIIISMFVSINSYYRKVNLEPHLKIYLISILIIYTITFIIERFILKNDLIRLKIEFKYKIIYVITFIPQILRIFFIFISMINDYENVFKKIYNLDFKEGKSFINLSNFDFIYYSAIYFLLIFIYWIIQKNISKNNVQYQVKYIFGLYTFILYYLLFVIVHFFYNYFPILMIIYMFYCIICLYLISIVFECEVPALNSFNVAVFLCTLIGYFSLIGFYFVVELKEFVDENFLNLIQ